MRRLLYFFVMLMAFGSGLPVGAQNGLPSYPVGTTRDGGLSIYGREGSDHAGQIPYEKISGSPFWQQGFIMATLTDKYNQQLAKIPVKLDLYSSEVYFKGETGDIRVVAPGAVTKIIFYENDTSSLVQAVFENSRADMVEPHAPAGHLPYLQVMNQGEVQLLKHTRIRFVTKDSLLGTKKSYSFSSNTNYYLSAPQGKLYKLKRLSKDALADKMPIDNAAEEWIRSQQMGLKTEDEVVRFLDFYNKQSKK